MQQAIGQQSSHQIIRGQNMWGNLAIDDSTLEFKCSSEITKNHYESLF